MDKKAHSTDSFHKVKEGLQNYEVIEGPLNDEGIGKALQYSEGNVQGAIDYYVQQYCNGVPGYSRDANTNVGDSSDEEYYNHPASKRRRTGPNTKYAPTKSIKRSTRNNELFTTNNKTASASSGNGVYQQLEGSRKRKPKEGKFLLHLFNYYDMIYYICVISSLVYSYPFYNIFHIVY